jgi:hypothetical protein
MTSGMTSEGFLAAVLAVTRDPDQVPTLPVPVEAHDAPETAYLLLSGAVDLLAERAAATETGLRQALRELIGAESVLRFEIYERVRRAEELERAARMREREIAMTERWLVPRLHREVHLFERRVEALEALTREPG